MAEPAPLPASFAATLPPSFAVPLFFLIPILKRGGVGASVTAASAATTTTFSPALSRATLLHRSGRTRTGCVATAAVPASAEASGKATRRATKERRRRSLRCQRSRHELGHGALGEFPPSLPPPPTQPRFLFIVPGLRDQPSAGKERASSVGCFCVCMYACLCVGRRSPLRPAISPVWRGAGGRSRPGCFVERSSGSALGGKRGKGDLGNVGGGRSVSHVEGGGGGGGGGAQRKKIPLLFFSFFFFLSLPFHRLEFCYKIRSRFTSAL